MSPRFLGPARPESAACAQVRDAAFVIAEQLSKHLVPVFVAQWCAPVLGLRGADPNRGNDYGWTKLHQAGCSNDCELARLMLAAGARTYLFARGDGGTPLVAALFCTYTPVISPELRDSMLAISSQLQHVGWAATFFHAIGAGFLIAAMVWLLPGAESAQFHVIVVMTYLIAIAGFAHVVAGSIEAFMLVLNGQMGVWPMLADFFAPVLTGNIIGGTALFALIAYAQVMQEI